MLGVLEEGGHTNQNPHQSFQITWTLRNGLTREVLNLTTGIHPPKARQGPADGDATTVPRASNEYSVARLTADAPCHPGRTLPHPGRTLPLGAPVQQEVARESRRPLSYIKKAGM